MKFAGVPVWVGGLGILVVAAVMVVMKTMPKSEPSDATKTSESSSKSTTPPSALDSARMEVAGKAESCRTRILLNGIEHGAVLRAEAELATQSGKAEAKSKAKELQEAKLDKSRSDKEVEAAFANLKESETSLTWAGETGDKSYYLKELTEFRNSLLSSISSEAEGDKLFGYDSQQAKDCRAEKDRLCALSLEQIKAGGYRKTK